MNFTKKPLRGKFGRVTDEGLGVQNALYEFNPGKCLLPGLFEKYIEQIWDAPVRKDDVWLVSYPRTGSTWCQEMIWLIGNDLNFEAAQSTVQQIRAPLIEMSVVLYEYMSHLSDIFTNSVDYVNKLGSPRFIKTHLPFQLLPKEIHRVKPKLLYTIRHPKDLCVSYFHHCKLIHGFDVPFETFCELFLDGSVAYGNYIDHCLEFWNRRHDPDVLVLKYEDMKEDTEEAVRKISRFMERPLEEDQARKVADFLHFRRMKDNKGCNFKGFLADKIGGDSVEKLEYQFIRKGEVGDWRNHMSEEMSQKFDRWIEENTEGTDLKF